MASLKIIGNIAKEILVILTSILVLLGYPIILILLIFCWIYKQWAVKLARNDTKIQKVLPDIDEMFADQDPYNNPLVSLMPYYYLANELDVPTVVKVLKDKVIEPNLYPELSSRLVQKFGYRFWYSVDNFKVENHVRYLKPETPNVPITRTELNYILTRELAHLPFDSTQSPWEILVVPNMIDDRDPEVKSAVILRVNHCMMDGYAVAYFFQKVGLSKPWKFLSGDKLDEPKKDTNKCVEIYKIIILLFLGPYYFLKMFIFSNDQNQFVKNAYENTESDAETIFNAQCTRAIPVTRLKSVRDAHGVTMSSLIATLFGQATWKYMARTGIPLSNTIHGCIAFPLPGHADSLTNHCTMVRIPIKVNEHDPSKTLQLVEKEFQTCKSSVKPLVIFYANKMMALLPLRMRPSSKLSPTKTTFGLTNFPGPFDPCDFFGCMVTNFNLVGKLGAPIPFMHGSFSVAGNFWLQALAPLCSFPNQRDADVFCELIMDALSELEGKIK